MEVEVEGVGEEREGGGLDFFLDFIGHEIGWERNGMR